MKTNIWHWKWKQWLMYYCLSLLSFYIIFHIIDYCKGERLSFLHEFGVALSGSLGGFVALWLFVTFWPHSQA
jgi:hypothetical protein